MPLSPQNYPLQGSEVNGTHPAGLHAGSNSFGVASHTPPVSGTDTIMGNFFLLCHVFFLPFHSTCRCMNKMLFYLFIYFLISKS